MLNFHILLHLLLKNKIKLFINHVIKNKSGKMTTILMNILSKN